MKNFWICTSLFVSLVISNIAFAEKTTIVIGAGDIGGTYHQVVEEIAKFCSGSTLDIKIYSEKDKTSGKNKIVGGSINNLRNLLDNKIICGIIQGDIAYLENMKNEDMQRIIALVPLHREQVHLIVPTYVQAVAPTSKWQKLRGKSNLVTIENPITSLSQLNKRRVVAFGGSVKTAEITKLMSNVDFRIIPVENQKEALELISSGGADCILAVVGAPAKWVTELPKGKFKLLSVKDELEKLKYYKTTNISYDNLGLTGQSIKALAVDSILFTREYKTPQMIKALTELQTNIRKNIFLIRDTQLTHPVWQKIDPSRKIAWDRVFKQ